MVHWLGYSQTEPRPTLFDLFCWPTLQNCHPEWPQRCEKHPKNIKIKLLLRTDIHPCDQISPKLTRRTLRSSEALHQKPHQQPTPPLHLGGRPAFLPWDLGKIDLQNAQCDEVQSRLNPTKVSNLTSRQTTWKLEQLLFCQPLEG